jgi:hypothetical protein
MRKVANVANCRCHGDMTMAAEAAKCAKSASPGGRGDPPID